MSDHDITLADSVEPGDLITWETARKADVSELAGHTIRQATVLGGGLLIVLDDDTCFYLHDAELSWEIMFGSKRVAEEPTPVCSACQHPDHGVDYDYQYMGPELGEVRISDPHPCPRCSCQGEP